MRSYESMFITAPTVAPEAHERLVQTFADVITNGGGNITDTKNWGIRPLAYEIQRFKDGIYTIYEFEGPNDLIKELERRFQLNDSVLRYMTIKTERKARLERKGAARRQAKKAGKEKRKGRSEDRRHS